jgi:hypothetical protein
VHSLEKNESHQPQGRNQSCTLVAN